MAKCQTRQMALADGLNQMAPQSSLELYSVDIAA